MFYKDPTFYTGYDGFEYQTEKLLFYTSKTNISSTELPKYLGFPEFYEFVSFHCRSFVENFKNENFEEVSNVINAFTQKFLENINLFKDVNIDFSTILSIFADTSFLYSLYKIICTSDENYFQAIINCSFFICTFTYMSNDFCKFLSKEDFLYPLTNFYMTNYQILTPEQLQNIFYSINNLIIYYDKDPQFNVFFCNSNGFSFHSIFDAFQKATQPDNLKLVKFFYIITEKAKDISPFYPLLIHFFVYMIDTEMTFIENNGELHQNLDQIFNFIIISLYFILTKDPNQIAPIFISNILEKLNYFYKSNEKCGDHWINFYVLVTEVIKNYDINVAKENLAQRITTIFVLLKSDNNDDIERMLKSVKSDDNDRILDLIDALVRKKLFENFFVDKIKITNDIIELLEDSPLKTKMKALNCLKDLLKTNFTFYSETIFVRMPTSIFTDFILSEDPRYQNCAFSFIRDILNYQEVLSTAIPQNDSQVKNFAFLLHDDDELMEAISSFIEDIDVPYDEQIKLCAKIAHQKIFFWIDIPYPSTNTLNDNYQED